MKVICRHRVFHDGKKYLEGESGDFPKGVAAALIECKAARLPKKGESLKSPDMRLELETKDTNAGSGAVTDPAASGPVTMTKDLLSTTGQAYTTQSVAKSAADLRQVAPYEIVERAPGEWVIRVKKKSDGS